MFHLNFSHKSIKPSWGIEVAYWDFSNENAYGFDVGIEFQKPKFRIYSEAQAGLILVGSSAGFGVEFQKEVSPKLFLQGSIWANAFIGLDIRFRTKKEDYFAPGIYTKVPIFPGGYKNFREEYSENHPQNENRRNTDFDLFD